MKVFIYITLALGIVRAIGDYSGTVKVGEKVGVLIVVLMFLTSILLTANL